MKLIQRIKALSGATVEQANLAVITREEELHRAENAISKAQDRRKAALEDDADDAAINAIEDEIASAKASRDRIAERLAIARNRLATAETDASERAREAARLQLKSMIDTKGAAFRKGLADAYRAQLRAIISLAEAEVEADALQRAGGMPINEGVVERIARSRPDGRETVLRVSEVELWAGAGSPTRSAT